MNPRQRFRDRLAAGAILADGGLGTLLFSRGIPQRACLDELPTTRPDLIGAIHREYLEAGADMVETASFGANRVRLAEYGLSAQAHRFSRRAAQVAREARDVAGREALVGGSVGPLGHPARDIARLDDAAARAAYREQIDGLLEGGVDLFVLETHVDLAHLLLAVEEARAASDLPVVAQLTFGEELALPDGTSPATAAQALAAAGVDAFGVNCGVGPHACLDALRGMATGHPGGRPTGGGEGDGPPLPVLSIMPNAGLPQRIEGQFVYAASPEYFASMTARFLGAGAGIVGGCCGTTPQHVAAMRAALDAVAESDAQRARARAASRSTPRAPGPAGHRSPRERPARPA